MSTKKLQIVTPIVTSVNGETGDVELNSLKNPNALTFTGGVTGTYDGSSAKTVAIPVVDSALSTTSTNAIQNKAVKTALDGKANSTHTHDEYLSHPIQLQETTDYGSTLPSNPTNGRLFFQETSVTSLIDLVYPVGAVYISMNQTSPQTLFGGTWTQIQGRFLIGAGTVYPAGSTGGEAEHTLTARQLPGSVWQAVQGSEATETSTAGAAGAGFGMWTGSQDWGQPHNNMPPYMAVYMWYRTA